MSAALRPFVLAAAAFAALAAAAPASAAPAHWTVDKATSKITFRSSFGGQAFEGTFRRWDANIVFDPKALAASKAVVTVDVASAATGDQNPRRGHPDGRLVRRGALPARDLHDPKLQGPWRRPLPGDRRPLDSGGVEAAGPSRSPWRSTATRRG
ncbi:MAG: YceI family protein [Caulobacteraceae bacterium]